ncbi:MAG: hypothetical protein CVU58_04450 [Deltaproteobacteria bacterium HGW-Deltaproteobacteria-16]|nr:MAG: hypothetical protein CVU58_04450 [Deltaproteobacteria bacterium HGW-Deltaproteobacteria-16]
MQSPKQLFYVESRLRSILRLRSASFDYGHKRRGLRSGRSAQDAGISAWAERLPSYYERGKRWAGLGVDAQSLTGVTRLYETAGMRMPRQSALYEKELSGGQELGTQTVG